MYIRCYRTSAPAGVQEQLWQCAEWVHACAVEPYAEFYIREDRVFWALMIDPQMTPVPRKDHVA